VLGNLAVAIVLSALQIVVLIGLSASNVTVEAWLSLAVVAGFAAALTAISIRMFSRSAVH
jgi:hypothetical protein